MLCWMGFGWYGSAMHVGVWMDAFWMFLLMGFGWFGDGLGMDLDGSGVVGVGVCMVWMVWGWTILLSLQALLL